MIAYFAYVNIFCIFLHILLKDAICGAIAYFRLNLPGNHGLPDLKQYQFEFVLMTRLESKNREMQGDDGFQPFFGLIASTSARSQLRKEHESRKIQSSSDQSSSEEDYRESSPNSKSSASHDSQSKESERSEILCEWMFEGFWYFWNEDGLLPEYWHTWKSKKISLTRFGKNG